MARHVSADEKIADWLNRELFYRRSNKQGQALCEFFLDDLLTQCRPLAEAANRGEVVYDLDYTVGRGAGSERKVQPVLGPPTERVVGSTGRIMRGEPREIWLAVDAKSIMTEHGKARRNRQRDLNSFWNTVKKYHPRAVTAGLMLVNIAGRFRSPLRTGITQHRNIGQLVQVSVELFRDIERCRVEPGSGIEAVGVIVVNHTNILGEHTTLVREPPAPGKDDIVNYEKAVELVAAALQARYFN